MSDPDDARDGYTIPLTRHELVFNLTMGLDKARYMWPRRRADQTGTRMQAIVKHIADHLERCNVRCYRRPPPPDRPWPRVAPYRDPRPEHARLVRQERRMLDARFGRGPQATEGGGTPATAEVQPAAGGTTPAGGPGSAKP